MTTAAVRPQPELRPLTVDSREAFLAAALRVYNADGDPRSNLVDWLPLYEPDRFFGFAVGERWVSTCGAFTRRLAVPGGEVPVAAVTFVSVSPGHRRQGLLTRMMAEQLADVHRRGEPVAILWASEAPIYGRFGYGSAAPRLHLSAATGLPFRPSVDLGDGWVEDAERETYASEAPALHARLRPTRVGALDRDDRWWHRDLLDDEPHRHNASSLRYALHRDATGAVDGYAHYRVASTPDGPEVRVLELDAATDVARAALWRFLLDLDLVPRFSAIVPLDDPLRHLVADVRSIEAKIADSIYVRLVDLAAALQARTYATPVDVVLGVTDRTLSHNDGTWHLVGGPDGARVTPADAAPDLELDVRELGEAYLGGTSLVTLARAGRVTERTPGALAATSRAFAVDRAPFCPDFF